MAQILTRMPAQTWPQFAACQGLKVALSSIQLLTVAPATLFLTALTAMLLRHPDVPFYEIDRVAFAVLVMGVTTRSLIRRQKLIVVERATWPMIGLAVLAIGSVIAQPFDHQAWCLLAAKFLVPYSLFHLARQVFSDEKRLRKFELFSLIVLAYLCFTSIAFLIGARSLIFPRFILDESLGYHADRARGPLLQAVANGVSLNLLGLLALHSFLRGRLRGIGAGILLASLPVAILATKTRAVWLSFAVSLGFLIVRAHNRKLRLVCMAMTIVGFAGLLVILSFGTERRSFTERFQESGPVDFREAVYAGGWQMFLEKPLTGWGVNRMPSELARHVSGYREKELFPHNTYLEILVEHGILGFALYAWLAWELFRLGRWKVPRCEYGGFLNQRFHSIWPLLLGVYFVNAGLVVMNYQFVNGLIFTMAGLLAAQRQRAKAEMQIEPDPHRRPSLIRAA